MQTLGVLGASGHGKVVADVALSSGWERVLFFDDAWPNIQQVGAWSVVGTTEDLINNLTCVTSVVVAIGNNTARLARAKALLKAGACFATIIHPHAIVSQYAEIGQGSVVLPGAVINAGAVIGQHCIINTNAVVEHDCHLGVAVHISPGVNLAGGVSVGKQTWVGIGASVKERIQIDESVTVGAGSVVIKDIARGQTVVGVPAQCVLTKEKACA